MDFDSGPASNLAHPGATGKRISALEMERVPKPSAESDSQLQAPAHSTL
jgi:hypothetical protein